MLATSEPRTLEEMHARIRAIHARQMAAARRYEASKHPVPVVTDPVPAPASEPVPEAVTEELAAPSLAPAETIASVAAECGVTAEEIIGPSLKAHVVAARFAAVAAVASAHPHMSLTQIGKVFGGRDTSTIWNALRRAGAQAERGERSTHVTPLEPGRSPDARSPEQILQDVATAYGTTVPHLRGQRHTAGLSAARRAAIVAIRAAHPGLSVTAIALVINREPSGVRAVLRSRAAPPHGRGPLPGLSGPGRSAPGLDPAAPIHRPGNGTR